MEQEAYKAARKLLDDRRAAGDENLTIKYRNGKPEVVESRQKNMYHPH